jgi:hypothetical protein
VRRCVRHRVVRTFLLRPPAQCDRKISSCAKGI